MAYTALYRKFRPLTFSEIVGQEHVTQTLKNQIIANRVGHAYIFDGGRGTGKTSAAKILSRAVNCLNPKDGEPCNECEICKAALSGSLTDIVEMDAASNNSVEDIRLIREEVNFLPTKAKYRVYIIDEVHMLSTGAFNALLKTLEEPPEHVKFILATTEPQKIPATILSRCQRFDFKRISNDNIIARLEEVCKESKIDYTKPALNMIAILAQGAMRDALSILDRCVQDGTNQINEEKIRSLIGIPKITYVHNIVDALIEYNIDKAMKSVDDVLTEGQDITNFVFEIIKYVKDVLLYKISEKLDMYSKEELFGINDLSKKVSKEKLISLVYELSNLSNDIKTSTQKTIIFEAGIIKLCNKEPQKDDSLNVRVEKLEKIVENKTFNVTKSENIKEKNIEEYKEINPIEEQSKKKENKIQTKKLDNLKSGDFWNPILNDLKAKGKFVLYTNLTGTVARQVNDLIVEIEFPQGLNDFKKALLEKQENKKILSDMVSIAIGKPMQVKYISNGNKKENKKQSLEIQDIAQGNDIPFNVIE